MTGGAAIGVAVVLVALSAFFVAVEFALVAARRHRLEEAAPTSAAARAALRSARDLSLLLAGSQLGITLCTLGLGAIAKPAVHDLLLPVLTGWGLPEVTADVAAFAMALVAVTFVHLVVGEMAPKSWAIAHPERSAVLLALPMRAFLTVTRPLLVALNALASTCLRRVGVEPVDELGAGRSPDDLRELVDHSATTGTLDRRRHDRLVMALDLDTATVGSLTQPIGSVATVGVDADPEEIREATRSTGHLRLVVRDGGRLVGVVHVRDALAAAPGLRARDLMRPVLTLPADEPASAALRTMRERRTHLALVRDGLRGTRPGPDLVPPGGLMGLLTLQDLLDRLLPTAPKA
jgi:CBS domain containing-hemolysin-like protein